MPEIDDLVLRIRGLVRAHERLRERGLSAEVLAEHATEIDRLQMLLAEQVRVSLTPQNGATSDTDPA